MKKTLIAMAVLGGFQLSASATTSCFNGLSYSTCYVPGDAISVSDTTITGTLTQSGGAASINASSNFGTSINTGTSSGNISLGNALNTTTINSGTTTITGTTNINTSGTAATTLGNSTAATTVSAIGGSSSMNLLNGTASLGTTDGSKQAGLVAVNAGSVGTVVDANGKLSTGTTTGSTAALTVTNSLGNVHGIVVQESQTTISGGNYSSSLTLTDNGARFSNASTGGPITVTGVADGHNDFDAINLRQFSSAIAGAAAMANIPPVDTSKEFSLGVGLGSYADRSSIALGGSYRMTPNSVLRASVAGSLNYADPNTTWGLGAAWSW